MRRLSTVNRRFACDIGASQGNRSASVAMLHRAMPELPLLAASHAHELHVDSLTGESMAKILHAISALK